MSEESTMPDPVELVRHAIEAANRGDYEAIMSLFAPDVVWRSLDGLGTFNGAPAVQRFLEDYTAAYDSFDTQPEQIRDMGGGVILAVIRHTARLGGGAGRVAERYAWVIAFERGLAALVLAGMDIDQARVAAERLTEERA